MDRKLEALLVVAQHLRLGPQEANIWRICRAWYSENLVGLGDLLGPQDSIIWRMTRDWYFGKGRKQMGDQTFNHNWRWTKDHWPSYVVMHGLNTSLIGLQEFRITLPSCLPQKITDAWSLLCTSIGATNEYRAFAELQNAVSMRTENGLLIVSIADVVVEFFMAHECLVGPYIRKSPPREGWYIDCFEEEYPYSLFLELQEQGMGCLKLAEHESSGQQNIITVCWLPNVWLAEIRDQLNALWKGNRA